MLKEIEKVKQREEGRAFQWEGPKYACISYAGKQIQIVYSICVCKCYYLFLCQAKNPRAEDTPEIKKHKKDLDLKEKEIVMLQATRKKLEVS